MSSPNRKPIFKTASQLSPCARQICDDDRFYSPQPEHLYDIEEQRYKSDNKKTTRSQEENEEIYQAYQNTRRFIFNEEDENYSPEEIEDLQQENRSQISENCHSKARVITMELTGKTANSPPPTRMNTEISCQCDYNAYSLLSKKKWRTIEVEEDAKILRDGKWTKTRCMLTKDRLAFIEIFHELRDISKIKIFQLSKDTNEQVIKIQVDEQSHFFALDSRRRVHDLPLPYYMFARLVLKKIEALSLPGIKNWEKTGHIENSVTLDSYIYGLIQKKSQHLGLWSERFVVIKKEGIYSYRDPTRQENYSYFISKPSVKYIWTRLEVVSSLLIIKIMHGITKTEFAIPINNYSCRGCKNWLYDFHRMLL